LCIVTVKHGELKLLNLDIPSCCISCNYFAVVAEMVVF